MLDWIKRHKKLVGALGAAVAAVAGSLEIALPEGLKTAFKFIMAMCLVMVFALGAGCAAYNYPDYAQHQRDVFQDQAKAKVAIANGLAVAAASEDARTRDTATLALLVMALTDKPLQIEAPREGALEAGLSAMLYSVPGVAQSYLLAREIGGSAGTQNYTIRTDGQGHGVILNTGIGSVTANPSTAPPTVVTQPEPVVVGGD